MISFPEAPQSNDLNSFRSLLAAHGDLAKVARFAVSITKAGMLDYSKDLSFLCDNAELSGRAFHTLDVRYYGPTFLMPFQSVYNNITLSFLCRDRFWERQFFDLWMSQINPKSTYDFTYRDEYCASGFNIFQFSEAARSNKEMQYKYVVSLRKAYPINVNPMPLSWGSEDIHRLQVTFAFTEWVSPTDQRYESMGKQFKLISDGTIENGPGTVLGDIRRTINTPGFPG